MLIRHNERNTMFVVKFIERGIAYFSEIAIVLLGPYRLIRRE
jgi:hypothetical protein